MHTLQNLDDHRSSSPPPAPRPTITARYRLLLACPLLAIGLLAGACGSGDVEDDRSVAALPDDPQDPGSGDSIDGNSNDADSDRDSDEPVSEADAEAAMLAFEQCLADEGVEDPFGDLDGEGGGVVMLDAADEGEFEAFQAAQEKCTPILEDAFGEFELSPAEEAAQKDAEVKFNQCMTDLGFDVSGEGGIAIGEDFDSDAINEAFEECGTVFEEIFGSDGAAVTFGGGGGQ